MIQTQSLPSSRASRRRLHRHRPLALVAGVVSLVFALSASAGGAITAARRGATKSPATTITDNWATFFSGASSPQQKVALLQNGSKFASIIKAQASLSLSKSSHAKVLAVSAITKSNAKVRYTIYLGNTPALVNQNGTAVFQSGTWRVSDASFCVLLELEGTKTANCPS